MMWTLMDLEPVPGIPSDLIAYTKWVGLSVVIGSLIVTGARIADARHRGSEMDGVRSGLLVLAAGLVIATAPSLVNWLLGAAT